MQQDLIIQGAQIIALRLFDIAYAIDLGRAEQLWQSRGISPSTRSRLASTPAKALSFETPPLLLALESVELLVCGKPVMARAYARVYDFGVISLSLRLPVNDLSWSAFTDNVLEANTLLGNAEGEARWASMLDSLKALLGAALIRPTAVHLQEDYLMGVVGRLCKPLSAQELLASVDVVPLLSGERKTLSEGAKKDLLRQSHSYYEDDLVILTWDRALIYEPRGESDVIDVLEVANAQLLEMRYYDELLDDELPQMYDRVEAAHRVSNVRAPGHYADLARKLHTLVAEVTELTERVDNALQVMEDVYLARVYTSALELFRVPKLNVAVDRKLAIIKDTYTALYDEASARRATLLEITIVVLILIELLLALVRH